MDRVNGYSLSEEELRRLNREKLEKVNICSKRTIEQAVIRHDKKFLLKCRLCCSIESIFLRQGTMRRALDGGADFMRILLCIAPSIATDKKYKALELVTDMYCKEGCSVAKLLLDNGAQIDSINNPDTLLRLEGNPALLDLLVERGLDRRNYEDAVAMKLLEDASIRDMRYFMTTQDIRIVLGDNDYWSNGPNDSFSVGHEYLTAYVSSFKDRPLIVRYQHSDLVLSESPSMRCRHPLCHLVYVMFEQLQSESRQLLALLMDCNVQFHWVNTRVSPAPERFRLHSTPFDQFAHDDHPLRNRLDTPLFHALLRYGVPFTHLRGIMPAITRQELRSYEATPRTLKDLAIFEIRKRLGHANTPEELEEKVQALPLPQALKDELIPSGKEMFGLN